MKDFLEDEEAVERKQQELAHNLSEYNRQIDELEKRLAGMLNK